MSETCPDIHNINFSHESRSALRLIQSKLKFASFMKFGTSVGTLFAVLFEKKPIPQMVNIKRTDWHLFTEAVGAIDGVARHEIDKISLTMAMRTHGDENKFWKAVHYGCVLK